MTKKIKTIAILLFSTFSAMIYADDEIQTKLANSPFAQKYHYPYTRTVEEGMDRNEHRVLDNIISNNELGGFKSLKENYPKHDDGVDHYYDDVVVDKYRWLENIDEIRPEYLRETTQDRERNYIGTLWENPDKLKLRQALETVHHEESEVNKWVEAQNAATENYLKKIPYFNQVKQNIDNLTNYEYEDFTSDTDELGSFRYFRKSDGYYLLVRKDKNGKETVVFNERELSKDGNMRVYERFLNKKGNYFAVIAREGNSDSDRNYLYVWDTTTGKQAMPRIGNIDKDAMYLVWLDDNSFYYLRNSDMGGDTNVMLHHMNKKEINDEIIVKGAQLNYASPSSIWLEDDNRYLVIKASYGNASNLLYFKDLHTGRIKQIHMDAPVEKTKKQDAFMKHIAAQMVYFDDKTHDIYIISTDNNEFGELFKVNLDKARSQRELLVPANGQSLVDAVYQNGHFVLQYTSGGVSRLVLTDMHGKVLKELGPKEAGYIADLSSDLKDDSNETENKNQSKSVDDFSSIDHISFRYENPITPRTIYKYSIEKDEILEKKRKDLIPFDSEKYETHYLYYTSKDGTRIPISISYKKGIKLDGKNPTVLYGYGGFGSGMELYFNPKRAAWMEHGGIYAQAFLRGGDEYGEAWHQAGKQLNKQNVFDDFEFAARFLIENKYTSSDYLAIEGESNGGLLIGAALTQHPELYRVAIPSVGVMDMLRHDKNYRTDYWINEYGMTDDSKRMYKFLRSYSPYHNIKDNVCYPSTLVMTSKRDDRVSPAHSYKFTALLQEKQACDRPIFLFAAQNHGHSPNTYAERKEDWLYGIVFELNEMGFKELPSVPEHLK